jgi:carbonic anhydrase/acetyltransferase-like protein (isoleucine patch superfamily)
MASAFRRLTYEVGRAIRETGSAIDRIGLRAIEKPLFKEPFARHRPTMNLFDRHPAVSADAFIAPNAAVVGKVEVQTRASIMYGAVVRGDLNDVLIGAYSSVGDRAVIHTTKSVEGHVSAGVTIGTHVSIGPGAMLQSCTVEDGAVIGANAVVMEGSLVETTAKVAEGAVVHPGRRIPAGQLWAGNPAVFIRDLSKTELADAAGHAEEAADLATEHAHEFLPFNTAYQQAEALGVEDAVSRAGLS